MIRLPKSLVAAVAGASFFTSVIGDAMACPPRGGGGGYRPVYQQQQYYYPQQQQYAQPQACPKPIQPALTQEQLIQQQMLGGQFPQQTQQGQFGQQPQGQFAQQPQGQFAQTQQGQFAQQPTQGQFGQQQQFRGQQSPSLTIQNGGQVAGGQAGGQVAGGQVAGGQVAGGQVAGGQVSGQVGGQVAGGQPAAGQPSGGASASALNALGGSGAAGQQVQQQPVQSQPTQSQQIQSQPVQSQQLQTQQTPAQPVQNTGAPAVAQNNNGTPAADKSALDMALEALMGPTAQASAQETTTTSAPVGEFTSSISTGAQVRLSLRADSSFTWVAAKGEKQNTFQGSYSLAGNALTLVRSDNTKLEGTLTPTTAGFQLKLAGQNDNGLSFVRAAAFASR